MISAPPRAEKSSNFFIGFLVLPARKRAALSAVYAYCRLIDDIVDSGDLPKEEARAQLAFWRLEIGRLFEGTPSHPVAIELRGPIAEFGIPKESFLEMIRGCELDLDDSRYETLSELESYMRGVASSVGVMCVHIFGWKHTSRENMLEFAKIFGYAFQLTNIIRDVGADLDIGRVYLPEADLLIAGYSRERLLKREDSPELRKALESLYLRAKEYYASARKLVDARDRRALLPAELMAHVYEGLLDEIAAGGFRVLHKKTRLPAHRKLVLALKGWLYCHGF